MGVSISRKEGAKSNPICIGQVTTRSNMGTSQ